MYTGTKRNMSAHAEEKGEEKMTTATKEKILLGCACFFAGMVLGFYSAPIKKGISVSCGNNNTVQKEK